jgi:hypothetical protein
MRIRAVRIGVQSRTRPGGRLMNTTKLSRRSALASGLAFAATPAVPAMPAETEDTVVTYAQLAAQHFEPDAFSDDFTGKFHGVLDSICLTSGLAIGVLRQTKAGLIESLKKMDNDPRLESDAPEAFLGSLVGAQEDLSDLLKILQGAEVRVAVALANIRPDDRSDA